MRGLNPLHCRDGVPSEGCFIFRRDRGPSFAIRAPGPSAAGGKALGRQVGISPDDFLSHMRAGWGAAGLNVGDALRDLRHAYPDAAVAFHQKDEASWGEHARAHAEISGHQQLANKAVDDFRRHLARLAARNVLIRPAAPPAPGPA